MSGVVNLCDGKKHDHVKRLKVADKACRNWKHREEDPKD